MSKVFAVYGASGCGRSLMPVAVDQLQRLDAQADSQIIFIDDALVKDPNTLAHAIEQLVTGSELRVRMGNAGRQLAEREFAIEKVVEQHLAIYQQAN